MNTHRTPRAFSLIETLIVSGLVAALSGIFALFFIYVHGEFFGARAAAEVQKDASEIIRELETFVVPANRILASVSINGDDYVSGAETLILEVPAVTDSGTLVSGVSDTVVLYVDGNRFMRRVAADGQSARVSGTFQIADTVQELAFSFSTEDVSLASVVSVELHTHALVKERVVDAERRAQFTLRNFNI